MNIYKVEALFEDFESTWTIPIGVFNDKEVANSIKTKWEKFFKESESLFDEPENWDSNKDEFWSEEDYDEYGGFSWRDSYQYNLLISKYSHVREFSSIEIEEMDLNVDCFIDGFKHHDAMSKLIIEFNRDFKLGSII